MFGVDILDSTAGLALIISLAAGVLSFMSPCVLPIVPPYLAYMGGLSVRDMTADGRRSSGVLPAAVCFVLGLSTVFILLGVAASALGRLLLQYQAAFGIAAGAVVALFGLHFLGVLRVPLFNREARVDVGDRGGSVLGAYVLGLAFAFGWTPCIGPILGGILSLVVQDGSTGFGMWLMAAYAAGLGLPFLLAAIFVHRSFALMSRLKRHMSAIERGSGALLLVVAFLLLTGRFSALSFWLLEEFPVLGRLG